MRDRTIFSYESERYDLKDEIAKLKNRVRKLVEDSDEMHEKYVALEIENERLRAANEWRPIDDAAKTGEWIEVAEIRHDNWWVAKARWWEYDNQWSPCGLDPTHYRPRPQVNRSTGSGWMPGPEDPATITWVGPKLETRAQAESAEDK